MEDAIESMWAELPHGDVGDPWEKLFLVGPTGLGKKELAKLVYGKLLPVFPHTAYVTVGRDRDMDRVFKDLLQQLSGQNYEQDGVSEYLKNYLEDTNNRYLILIDDISVLESWEIIRSALAHCNHGSRVIATFNIAMNVNKRIWKREPPVDDDSCKALFCRAVLGADGKSQDNDHLDEVCEEVDLKKCGGVPLAIIAFASLLASKPRDKWYRVCKSINFGPKENPNVENISMSLSYYGLPSRLRSCLMHLSNFKWTNKVSSIWKWVAEGFLGTDEEVEGLFEIGEVYFNILDKTSMIQQADMYEAECYLEGCRMNDMMLHLIRSSSSRQKFVRITDNEHEEVASESNVSRLAIIGGKRGKIDRIRKMVSLKSLCASHYEVDKIIEVWSDFKGLCVLDLIRCTHSRKSNRRLTGIGNLVQLKYLGLEGTPVDELEEEDVENLSCLQTLNLRHTGLEKLPSSIGQLGKLVCLWADDRTTFPAGLLRNLKSLQDLQLRLRSGAAGSLALVLELSKLTELRSLNIGVDDKLEAALAESMGCLEKIRSLVIRSASKSVTTHLADGLPGLGLLRCLSLEGICFSKMPACIISSSSTLRRLAVAVEILEETDAQSLRILPELTCLNLVVAAPYTGSLNNAGALFFRKLKFCTTNVLPAALLPLPAPVLEVLQFAATVQDVLVTGDHPADLGLGLLPSLRNVTVLLNCWGASAEEQQKAEAALRAVANRDGSKIQVIKENQGGKVLNTLQLPERLRQENPLLGPELAKMRGNQQIPRRIMLETELSQLDADMKKLETMVREQPRNSALYQPIDN